MNNVQTDLVIVGAGIVGLSHAVAALERGLTVTIIDRDSRAVGASVRNFGHACVTAQTGELLELALVAREKWLRYSALAGFFCIDSGALTLARSDAELAVLDELAASRDPDQVRMIGASEARASISATADERILGGAVLRDDLRVDPREAVAGLAAWISEQPGASILWRTSYLGTDGTEVRTSRGTLRAAHTIVCVGHDVDYLYPDLADTYEIERCALQMALLEPPPGVRIRPAILTGTSMLRYPAFAETAAAVPLRAEVQATAPELIDIVANVMFTQRPDGSLIVGDSHSYGLTHPPFLHESVSDTLLAEVARIVGVSRLSVRQRWQGVYASSPKQPFVIAHPSDTVTVAVVSSGVGMTISLGLAERTFTELDVRMPVTGR